VAQSLEVCGLPRPHDALQVHEDHGPECEHGGRKQVEEDDDDEGTGALVADQHKAPEVPEDSQAGVALGRGRVGRGDQGPRVRAVRVLGLLLIAVGEQASPLVLVRQGGLRGLPRALLLDKLLQRREDRDAARGRAAGRAVEQQDGGVGQRLAARCQRQRALGFARAEAQGRGVAPPGLPAPPRGQAVDRDGAPWVAGPELGVVPALISDLLRGLQRHLCSIPHLVLELVPITEVEVEDL